MTSNQQKIASERGSTNGSAAIQVSGMTFDDIDIIKSIYRHFYTTSLN